MLDEQAFDSGMGLGGILGEAGMVIVNLLQAGGPVMAIIAGCSVVATTVFVLKIYQFYAVRIGERQCVANALISLGVGRRQEALLHLSRSRNPIARVIEVAIRGTARPGVPAEIVRNVVEQEADDQIEALRTHMRVLEVIASLSPLLGLFGTVLGMVEAFRRMEAAGSSVDPSILSGGIWVALLTTAAGLAVAIPAVAAVSFLERRIEILGNDMRSAMTRVWAIDVIEEEPEAGPSFNATRPQAAW